MNQAQMKVNIESWQYAIKGLESFVRGSYGPLVLPPLLLARQIAQSAHAERFWAGLSMRYLMISTKHKHGLDTHDPFISISEVTPERPEYWQAAYRNPMTDTTIVRECAPSELFAIVEPMLETLWRDTQTTLARELIQGREDADLPEQLLIEDDTLGSLTWERELDCWRGRITVAPRGEIRVSISPRPGTREPDIADARRDLTFVLRHEYTIRRALMTRLRGELGSDDLILDGRPDDALASSATLKMVMLTPAADTTLVYRLEGLFMGIGCNVFADIDAYGEVQTINLL